MKGTKISFTFIIVIVLWVAIELPVLAEQTATVVSTSAIVREADIAYITITVDNDIEKLRMRVPFTLASHLEIKETPTAVLHFEPYQTDITTTEQVETVPLYTVLLIDNSGSMGDAMGLAMRDAMATIAKAPTNTQFAVMSVNKSLGYELSFTSDPNMAMEAVENIRMTEEGTCFHNGLETAVDLLQQHVPDSYRRAVIFFSDGYDENNIRYDGRCSENPVDTTVEKIHVENLNIFGFGYRSERIDGIHRRNIVNLKKLVGPDDHLFLPLQAYDGRPYESDDLLITQTFIDTIWDDFGSEWVATFDLFAPDESKSATLQVTIPGNGIKSSNFMFTPTVNTAYAESITLKSCRYDGINDMFHAHIDFDTVQRNRVEEIRIDVDGNSVTSTVRETIPFTLSSHNLGAMPKLSVSLVGQDSKIMTTLFEGEALTAGCEIENYGIIPPLSLTGLQISGTTTQTVAAILDIDIDLLDQDDLSGDEIAPCFLTKDGEIRPGCWEVLLGIEGAERAASVNLNLLYKPLIGRAQLYTLAENAPPVAAYDDNARQSKYLVQFPAQHTTLDFDSNRRLFARHTLLVELLDGEGHQIDTISVRPNTVFTWFRDNVSSVNILTLMFMLSLIILICALLLLWGIWQHGHAASTTEAETPAIVTTNPALKLQLKNGTVAAHRTAHIYAQDVMHDPYQIGRMGCDWNLPEDGRLHEKHLQIRFNDESEQFELRDLGADNFTWLNNAKLTPYEWEPLRINGESAELNLGGKTKIEVGRLEGDA